VRFKEDEKRTEVRVDNAPRQKEKRVCSAGFGGLIAVAARNLDMIYEPEAAVEILSVEVVIAIRVYLDYGPAGRKS